MEITADKVKELRERTGIGMMECKAALSECDCDMDKAIEILRKKGYARAEAKSSRAAKEGFVGSYIHMNGREVFKFAVRVMGEAAEEVLAAAGLDKADLDFFIPHQANIRIIEAAAKRLGLPMGKVLVNVDRYGNTSTASIPLALEEAVHGGRIKKGDHIVMVGFGAGLTWGAVAMKW